MQTTKFVIQVGADIRILCSDAASLKEALHAIRCQPQAPVAPGTRRKKRPRISGDLQDRFGKFLESIEGTKGAIVINTLYEAKDRHAGFGQLATKLKGDARSVGTTAGRLTRAAKEVGLDPKQVVQRTRDKETHEVGLLMSGKFAEYMSRQVATS